VSLLVTLAIILAIAYSAYSGSKRGMVLVSLELVSFAAATLVATLLYRPVGNLIKAVGQVSIPLSDIAAFITIWAAAEVLSAVIIRFKVLPRIKGSLHASPVNLTGGAILNAVKSAAIITLSISLLANLNLSPSYRNALDKSRAAQILVIASDGLPDQLARSIGSDITNSLSFFTVTADPESTERIELGYTTTNVVVDPNDESAMLVLLNHERTTRGLKALIQDTTARSVARDHSIDMFARGYFSHISLDGRTPFDRMTAGGLKYGSAGENLALAPTLQEAHDGLMKSPGHRANILSPQYKHVGI
jgi:uncharacterized protein YkwD